MYPEFLKLSKSEPFLVNDKVIEIPKFNLLFDMWTGKPVKENFGGKPVVSFNNKPMFAELAIMNHFVAEGWEARWVETYGRSKKDPIFLVEWVDDKYKNQVHSPILDEGIKRLIADIAKINSDSYSGCWDVLAWKEGKVLFAESKRKKKDKIRSTQDNWLKSSLKYGLSFNDFLVVEWDFRQ